MSQLLRAGDQSGYLAQDTICALASAVGGAIAVVRVSGPAARQVLLKVTGRDPAAQILPRLLTRTWVKDSENRTLDDSLVVFFEGPKSFTGEDSFELHIHGGHFVASSVVEALIKCGVRQALPGEFSFRAVRNGKMSISEAEAIADLISASNSQAVDLALEKMSGTQNHLLRELAEELRQLATLGEIGIDFADQDVDEVSLKNLQKKVAPLLAKLVQLRDSFSRGSRIQDGVRVAFVGLPNAGKSSFFNALLGEDRSIVSEVAGTTRDVVRERLTLQGPVGTVTLRLEDTAGLRRTLDAVEQMGIERSHKAARDADLLIWVVDASSLDKKFNEVQQEWEQLGRPTQKTLGILTQIDRVAQNDLGERMTLLERLGVASWVSVSSVTGVGISQAAEAIAAACARWVKRDHGEVVLTRLDQVEAIRTAILHLERGVLAPEIDLFASDLRQALMSLSLLIGDTLPDDILGRVFSQFCIGK